MKKVIISVFAVLLIFCSFPVSAAAATDYHFNITSYDVTVKVDQDNTYHVKEVISVHFAKDKHGIYRDIPTVNHIKRLDGSTATAWALISNIKCSEDFTISRNNEYIELYIGDENKTGVGNKTYTISYDYAIGNDTLQGADEFYMNIIGTKWKTTISNVTFTIKMPKTFDESKLGMSYGKEGSQKTEGLKYSVNGKTIKGELDSQIVLKHKMGLTVRLELPEGYFVTPDSPFPYNAVIGIALAIIAVAVAFALWWKFGRDDPVVEVVEFYPPDDLNSLDLQFCYRGSVDDKGVTSLLVYLAQKGYIDIKEKGKRNFTITKKKAYDGKNANEREFFNALFVKGDSVEKKDLYDNFYKTANSIKSKYKSKKEKEKIFTESSINKGWILLLLSIVVYCVCTFLPIYNYYYDLLPSVLTTGLTGVLWIALTTAVFSVRKPLFKIIAFVLAAVAQALVCVVFVWDAYSYVQGYVQILQIAALLTAHVSIAVVMFFNRYMSKRTEYGTEILGRILGFKSFLETAEKDKLETMVKDDPQYFYKILPYAYVLDVSDKWIKKFESITIDKPDWYYGNGVFNIMLIDGFMRDSMMRAVSTDAMRNIGSSGGGFTGGGVGGGGGGAW